MTISSHIFAKEDEAHNIQYLRIFYDENKVKIGANIYLKLCTEKRQRLIGHYYFADKTLCLKRDSDKHFFHKTKSYGFNWAIINDDFLAVETISLTINSTKYIFPKKVLELQGRFMNFKQVGFELQKFLALEIIQEYKIFD
jgi:hypothetical protein